MERKNRKKIAPVVVAILVAVYFAPPLALVLFAASGLLGMEGGRALVPLLLMYGLIGGTVVVGVLIAMAQRLREINGGEEDEARKY